MPITKATGNVISPIKATGSTTPRALETRFADVFNVKDFGAVGDGVADDTAAIQLAINTIPANSCLYFPKGSYKGYAVQITKNITITGDGMDVTELVFGKEYGAMEWNGVYAKQSAYFNLNGGVEFTIRNLTIIDKFGLRATGKFIPIPHPPQTGWPIQPMGIAGNNRDSLVPADFANLIDVQNVRFQDLALGIETNAKKLNLCDSEFLCTYGYAGIGMPLYQLGNGPLPGGGTGFTYGDPPCMVLGCFGTAIIKNNYFNGLVDETFANANKPTNWEMYRIATDNFIENQMRQAFVDAWMTNGNGVHDYSNNTVVNHGIEGIHFYTGETVNQFPQRSSLTISNNFIKPCQKYFVSGYAETVNPCIAVGGRIPATKITGNRIENTYGGIAVDLMHFAAQPVPSLVGNIEISNNVMNGVKCGIFVNRLSERDIISNNTIFCQTKPLMLMMENLTNQGIYPPNSYSVLQGIYVSNCNPFVTNNTVNAEYDWELITTTTNQASNVFTLASTTGIPNTGFRGMWLVDPTQVSWKARWVPITAKSGNNVTVDSAWLNGKTFPNGTVVYFSQNAAFDTGGIIIVNQNNQVPNLNQVFYNTTIKEFFNDIQATDINGTNNSATLVNTTAINCQNKSSDFYPQPQFFREDGFYYKN